MLLILFSVVMVSLHQADASAVYTRWGRNVCASQSIPLYKGNTASGHYTHVGAGGNYICVHNTPQWSNSAPGYQANSGYIYGVEYEFNAGYTNNLPFSYANNGGQDLQNNDAPCVVCINPTASIQVMTPGRLDCPSADMSLEYNGFLVSAHYGHYRSEYVCLDSTPEVRPGGQADDNGGLFYPVQVGCGSMPCPPYIGGNEMTCSVCTF